MCFGYLDNAAETANPIMPVKDDTFSNTNAVTEYVALRRYHRRHGQVFQHT